MTTKQPRPKQVPPSSSPPKPPTSPPHIGRHRDRGGHEEFDHLVPNFGWLPARARADAMNGTEPANRDQTQTLDTPTHLDPGANLPSRSSGHPHGIPARCLYGLWHRVQQR